MGRSRQAKKTVHESTDDLRDQAGGIRSSIRDIGEAVKDVLIEKLTDMLKRAVSPGARAKETMRDDADEVRDGLEDKIQARPYKAVLIAAGVGLILGFGLRRR